jgi:hypothetical protein
VNTYNQFKYIKMYMYLYVDCIYDIHFFPLIEKYQDLTICITYLLTWKSPQRHDTAWPESVIRSKWSIWERGSKFATQWQPPSPHCVWQWGSGDNLAKVDTCKNVEKLLNHWLGYSWSYSDISKLNSVIPTLCLIMNSKTRYTTLNGMWNVWNSY